MKYRNRILQVLISLSFVAAPGKAASIFPYVTTDTSIFYGGTSNDYDSAAGLSQHVGDCYTATAQVVPCATLSSNPSTNTLGLTSASVTISNGAGTDPDNGVTAYGSAFASANLADGTLHAYADAPNCSVPNATGCDSEAATIAQFQDSLTFSNTTGQTQDIDVSWAFDGVITSLGTSPQYFFDSLFCFAPGTDCAGNSNDLPHAPIGYDFQFTDNDGGITNNLPDMTGFVSTMYTPGANATSETFSGVFAVPTGTSTDSLNAFLQISCAIADCDFSNTGALSIGPLPDGVSFTSGSGVLLTETTPEPGTWALLLCSGVLLAVGRRRRRSE